MLTLRHLLRFCGALIRHPGIPRWVRYGLLVLLAIPGPIDELAALPCIAALLIVRRAVVIECWRSTDPRLAHWHAVADANEGAR